MPDDPLLMAHGGDVWTRQGQSAEPVQSVRTRLEARSRRSARVSGAASARLQAARASAE